MKLAIISDIHGNLFALQAVLADADRAGVQQLFNLGEPWAVRWRQPSRLTCLCSGKYP
jgi:predicted phosphodiesterase